MGFLRSDVTFGSRGFGEWSRTFRQNDVPQGLFSQHRGVSGTIGQQFYRGAGAKFL